MIRSLSPPHFLRVALAQRAGFASASHLQYAFTKHFGCTPATYRKQTS